MFLPHANCTARWRGLPVTCAVYQNAPSTSHHARLSGDWALSSYVKFFKLQALAESSFTVLVPPLATRFGTPLTNTCAPAPPTMAWSAVHPQNFLARIGVT
jgi:hypothetical protein